MIVKLIAHYWTVQLMFINKKLVFNADQGSHIFAKPTDPDHR